MHRSFISIYFYLMALVTAGCVSTSPTVDNEEHLSVMKLDLQGHVEHNRQKIDEIQSFQRGVLYVKEDSDSHASVTYNNGDRIDIPHGTVDIDFFEEDGFLSSIQQSTEQEKNTNLRKIDIGDGEITVTTSPREAISKVVYTILIEDFQLTFKEGEIRIVRNHPKVDIDVRRGDATLMGNDPAKKQNLSAGQSVSFDLQK